jgi:hypothetical protein
MENSTPASKRHLNLKLMSVASAIALLAAAQANATTFDSPAKQAGEANGLGIIGTGALGIIGTGSPAAGDVSTQGIIGTGALGIIGTGSPAAGDVSTQGIIGTGALGIIGTGSPAAGDVSTQGIIGTGALGIIGTGSPAAGDVSTQGIIGTGALGIIGTGSPVSAKASGKGIIGTGTLGIIGTGALGIIGTGNPAPSAAVFEEWATTLDNSDASLMAYGPVDELSDNKIVILGQRIEVNDQGLLSKIRLGDTIAVLGTSDNDSMTPYRILRVQSRFVEGSTPIYVSAMTTSEQGSDGSFQIESASVRIGSAGANPEAFQIRAGMRVRIAGVKIGDVLIADDLAF